jgi:hypothetical protein
MSHTITCEWCAMKVDKNKWAYFAQDASRNPEQCSYLESQYSGSKQHGMLGWPLILSLPGQHTSTKWERRQLKDWACLAPSLTGEMACPSETVCCSTSSSSVLWWITHVRSGGPLPTATSGSCKCYNPSVFALRLTHHGTLVTGRFTRIWDSILRQPHQSTDWEFQLKVSWCGEPLSSATWKVLVPTRGWLKSPTGTRWVASSFRQVSAVLEDYEALVLHFVEAKNDCCRGKKEMHVWVFTQEDYFS